MRLYNGDCLEVMKHIPDGTIDMILCDLPYQVTGCSWDVIIPFEPLWNHYKRIIKVNGAIVLTVTQPFATDLINSNRKMFKYELIWAKTLAVGFANANKQPMRAHENILVFYNKQPSYNPQKMPGEPYTRANKDKGYRKDSCYHMGKIAGVSSYEGRMPTSIITVANRGGELTRSQSGRIHPTQKPLELFEWLIKTYTNEGETVLDNCAGSFTTGVACQNLGRKFIGIEKDPGYYKLGKQRMEDNRKLW